MSWSISSVASGLVLLLAGCGGGAGSAGGANASQTHLLVGAGDIAGSWSQDEATAKLLDTIVATATDPVTVFTAGDNVYNTGTPTEFTSFYTPTWGRHIARTRPSPGNHDYGNVSPGNASGYYSYFGAAAGPAGQGYYSYDLGSWHIISLNSHVLTAAQETWLRNDLANNRAVCTLVYWHHSRFSSGAVHGTNSATGTLFSELYKSGVDVLVTGHDHIYERFDPQAPNAAADPTGVHVFVVGTGGAALYNIGTVQPNSVIRNGLNTANASHGIIKFTLREGSYSWEFIPIAGNSFADSGSANCYTGTHP
jgi:acid phosphatase type 7